MTVSAVTAMVLALFVMLLSCDSGKTVVTGTTVVDTSEPSDALVSSPLITEPIVSDTVGVSSDVTEAPDTTEVATTVDPVMIFGDELANYPPDSPEYELYHVFANEIPTVEETTAETYFDEEGIPFETVSVFEREGDAALYYSDIISGKTVIVNGDKRFPAASMIKAVYVYSLMIGADEGLVNLDEEIEYLADMFVEGTGKFADVEEGSIFKVRELISYTLRHSDNTAYSMLRNRFGTELFSPAMEKSGISAKNYNRWWTASVTQYGEFFIALAKYFMTESENAVWLKEEMINSAHTVILRNALRPDKFAHKYGWDEDSYCDGGVAFGEDGVYVAVFMSDLDGGSDKQENTDFIYKVGKLVKKVRKSNAVPLDTTAVTAETTLEMSAETTLETTAETVETAFETTIETVAQTTAETSLETVANTAAPEAETEEVSE